MIKLARQLLILGITVAVWDGGAVRAQSLPNATAEIVILHQNATALEGSTLFLTCVGYGVPSPNMMWLKDGVELSNNYHVSIYSNQVEEGGVPFVQSTLEVCNLELADEGMYSCVATNDNGTDTRSFRVTVEPREEVDIVAQPESNEFEEGDTVTLTCVGYGTPDNPTITWSREGRVIGATSTVRIYQQVLEQGGVEFVLSNLEICGILLEQAGIYSCTATLQSGPTHTTSDFWVNITHAPEIVIAPEDSEVIKDSTIMLTCVGLGIPTPEVFWMFDGVTLSNFTNFRVSMYTAIVEQGGVTFVFSTLEKCGVGTHDMGQYSCVARDGERNATASFDLSILINAPTSPLNFSAVSLDPFTIYLSWEEPDDNGGCPVDKYIITIAGDTLPGVVVDGDVHSYQINKLNQNTSYQLDIVAVNTENQASPTVSLTVTTLPVGPPLVPTPPTVDEITNVSAVVSWTDPGGFPTFYILQVKISTENWSDIGVRVFNFTSNTLQQTLADLQPLVNYDIRIQSQNFNGLSDFSSEITFSTFGNIEITGPAQNEVIDSGMLVRLKCQLEVEQSMTGTIMYTWSREGGLLPNNSFQDGNGALVIPEAQESDSGVYICSANGVVGKVTLNIAETTESSGQDNPFFPWVYVAVAVAAVILIMVLAVILVRIWLKRYRSRKLPAGLTRRSRSTQPLYAFIGPNDGVPLTSTPCGSPQNMKGGEDDNDLKANQEHSTCTMNDVQIVGDEYVVMNREVKNPIYDATDTLTRDAQTSQGVYEVDNY